MYRTGVVISSNTTSADPSPCGLDPATASATAGRVASAALAAGKPVSGAIGRAGLLWPYRPEPGQWTPRRARTRRPVQPDEPGPGCTRPGPVRPSRPGRPHRSDAGDPAVALPPSGASPNRRQLPCALPGRSSRCARSGAGRSAPAGVADVADSGRAPSTTVASSLPAVRKEPLPAGDAAPLPAGD